MIFLPVKKNNPAVDNKTPILLPPQQKDVLFCAQAGKRLTLSQFATRGNEINEPDYSCSQVEHSADHRFLLLSMQLNMDLTRIILRTKSYFSSVGQLTLHSGTSACRDFDA